MIIFSKNKYFFSDSSNFLRSELEKLNLLTEQIVNFININLKNEPSLDLPGEILELLKDTDYTYLFFPDIHEPSANLSFLKRFLYSAEWFKKYNQKNTINFQSLIPKGKPSGAALRFLPS